MIPAEIELDEQGRLVLPGAATPVPVNRVADHLSRRLRIPSWATDVHVYVHGWQTPPDTATRTALRLLRQALDLYEAVPERYPGLKAGYRPWCVVVRWPSASKRTLGGYRMIRDRAHAMSAEGRGHAPYVIGHLLGYLDKERGAPKGPPVMAGRDGKYLHLMAHSFGGRFVCEAMQRAAERPPVLGWSMARDPRRPFTVDSALIFQMAAPRDVFVHRFGTLFPTADHPGAPLRGPIALTHSRWDRATGFWHLRAEGAAGIGHSGVGVAPVPQFSTRLLPTDTVYPQEVLDHRLVNIDADWLYQGSRLTRLHPSGAHSDFLHPESAHLLLTLAERSR
ncbi:alpha/beta hydrolase [Streptomyces cupreus]|uniref:Alpha/beta hydrolase n=1 Tax=Streptomyces cupreus TaxID=2759956 RepID=A0A7X1JD17_9ACTN|nr:alpha/beta hydrolase [Streptomyces cupreus]MBC2905907.1 alpha/beta hydrolase [Streptomyces cupreus]